MTSALAGLEGKISSQLASIGLGGKKQEHLPLVLSLYETLVKMVTTFDADPYTVSFQAVIDEYPVVVEQEGSIAEYPLSFQ